MIHSKLQEPTFKTIYRCVLQPECMIFVAEASVIDTLYTRSVLELNGSQKQLQSPSGFSASTCISCFSFLFYVFTLC